jgi:hypothetical protein
MGCYKELTEQVQAEDPTNLTWSKVSSGAFNHAPYLLI